MNLAISHGTYKADDHEPPIAFVDAAIFLLHEMYAKAVASGDTWLRGKTRLALAQLRSARGAR